MPEKLRDTTATANRLLPEEAWTSRLVIRNILCPVDFSEFSKRAIRYASDIAGHFDARLIVQHTVPIPTALIPEGPAVVSTQEMLQMSREDAKKELDRMISESETEGAGAARGVKDVLVVVSAGDVKDQIVKTVGEQNVDLVVMGTHGHKGLSRLVLGSVTEQIIHEVVYCPVLVVSHPQAAEHPQWKTILVPVDFSPDSGRALTHALRWGAEWKSRVILFHAVAEPPPRMHGMIDLLPEFNSYFDKEVAEAWERIHTAIPEAARGRCELSYEVREGNPHEQILEYAGEVKPDLIVMGSRGSGKSGMVWGSTISGIVRDGQYPVLAIRHLRD